MPAGTFRPAIVKPMNKKLKICLLSVCLPGTLLAQHKKETADSSQAIISRNYYIDAISGQTLDFARKSSYYLDELIPDHVSTAAATADFQRGKYIPSQGATTIKAAGFATAGSARLGTVKVFGSFAYQKTFEDSTRFAHQTRSNTSSPFYFGSPAYGHYERSVYTFKAMAGKNLLKEKLNLALGTDYKVGDHYANTDPRGSVGEYQFDLMASAGYRFSRSIKAGFAYRTGYGQERVSVGYKNERYYESSSYPMYYTHLINGYGEGTPWLTKRKYDDNQRRNGADLYLDIASARAGEFHLSGSYVKEHQKYFYSTSTGFTDYAVYDLKTKGASLLWLKAAGSDTRIGADLQYTSTDGKDYNLSYLANNYIYSARHAAARVFLTQLKPGYTLTHELMLQQNDEERVDGITGNDVEYNHLRITAGSGIRKNRADRSFFSINAAVSYQLPLSDTFQVNSSAEGYFTRYVIYHDYLYHTSSSAGGEISAAYGKPVFKTMLASVKLNLGYDRKLNEKTLDRPLAVIPGKDRFYSGISLNLYF